MNQILEAPFMRADVYAQLVDIDAIEAMAFPIYKVIPFKGVCAEATDDVPYWASFMNGAILKLENTHLLCEEVCKLMVDDLFNATGLRLPHKFVSLVNTPITVPPHRDPVRSTVYNCFIKNGEGGLLRVFDDEQNVLDEMQTQTGKSYQILDSHKMHSVTRTGTGPRYMLALSKYINRSYD